jgi:thymidylate synthase (FAD)
MAKAGGRRRALTVKLIAVSKPSEHVDANTAEELVAYCARVSNPANQANHGSAAGLIRYLIRNQHWSPLEMVHLTLEIDTNRTIARQILRHRSFAFQEFSQRYAEVPDFVPLSEARLQDTKNRQNSIETDDQEVVHWWEEEQGDLIDHAEDVYKAALRSGIAKEVARNVLPEGLTSSRLYMAGSLRSWIHYCQLRMGNGTQKEHQDVARACWQIICQEFPSITDVFKVDELDQLVQQFSAELLKKLKYKRDEDGFAGWDDPDHWDEGDMWESMDYAVAKGDPIDVAAFAAFIHARRRDES